MIVLDIASVVLLAAGALFVVSGGVGLLRFPDFYTRVHAAGITDSAGAGLILLGLLLRTPSWETGVRLLVIMLFLALTGPTASYVLAFAARRDGVPIWREGDPRR
ncbi:monovalent cation/H(+) antiporter subunit G [Actinophytocola gossypii]|uniref:Monovalent cation/H(+) antiporter subunit G n=1 Tax=Actinophytocola gossypii TaxID=2812003 RepID=A0ABT2J985_9PSEU|nr:monovalent cation/H(+) antiporter subunit G [Actinophytocola gossypii]MCT2584428.1 monovalent cation/H(+) antiporter subunit G [Actinophytocola gossypii]